MLTVAGLLVSAVLAQGAPEPDSQPRSKTTAFPLVSYSDVTGLQYGATVMRSFRTAPDSTTRTSSLTLYAAGTAKGHAKGHAQLDRWSAGNAQRWRARVEYISYPLPFFGIGASAPDSAEEWYSSGVTTVHVFAQLGLRPSAFLHAGVRYAHSSLRESESGGLLDQELVPGASGSTVVSGELGAVYDSRNSLTAPRAGTYARFIPSLAAKAIGSDFVFRRLTVDARRYGALGRFATAIQLQFDGIDGDAPFDQLPMVGADTAMRGYPRGRFRDRTAITAQAELRTPYRRRVGAVAFAGAGSVSSSLATLGSETWFPTAGVGLRFVLVPKDRTVARADLGFGRGSFGLSVGIGEAF